MVPAIHSALVHGDKLPPHETRRKVFQKFYGKPDLRALIQWPARFPISLLEKELACIGKDVEPISQRPCLSSNH